MGQPTPEELRGYSLFSGLFDPQLARIIALLRNDELSEGEVLVREGDVGDRVWCLARGEVEVLRQERPNVQMVIARLGPGQTIGEMEILDMQPRSATVIALTACTVRSLALRDILALQREDIATFATLMLNLARGLSRRMRQMDDAVIGRTTLG